MVWAAERLRQLAITDELTGLYNRRFFMERWSAEVERARRYGRSLSCLILDINGFKQVNDLLGHRMGDQVLRQVAEEMRRSLRQSDLLARFGGDEFIVALPETDLDQAQAVVSKLQGIAIPGPWIDDAQIGPIRLSVGVSQMQKEERADAVIQRADLNLYESRRFAA